MNTQLSIKYVKATVVGVTKTELIELRKEASTELTEIKKSKNSVFERFKGVHGRFQHSQLDVLDIRETKVCHMIDNIDELILKAVSK